VIVGRPRVELTIDVTQSDADIVVFLYELPSGEDARAVRVAADGRLRLRYRNGFDAPELLTPGEPVRATIELPSMARRFAAGSQVLLLIASGGCELAENPHTGEPLTSQTAMRSATLRLQLGRDSRLILPRIE
jgi:predicted acyl esterase